MGLEDLITRTSQFYAQELSSRELARRRFFVHPAEPPYEKIMNNPSDSIYLAKTKLMHVPFHWTYANLTNPHIAVVGITGSGKSYLVKSFLTRAALVWGSNAVIIDWVGEYTDYVKQSGGRVLRFGKGDYLNLLDLGGMAPYDRIDQIMRSLEILLDLSSEKRERRHIEEALEGAYAAAGFEMSIRDQRDRGGEPLEAPTLKEVLALIEKKLTKAKEAGNFIEEDEVKSARDMIRKFTRKGQDYFARPSTIRVEDLTSSGLVDFVLTDLPSDEFRSLAGLMMLQLIKERMRTEGWTAEKGIKLFVVLDEAWKIAKDPRSDAITIVREGRKYQFSLLVATQNPTDVNEAIFSNVGTLLILRLQFKQFKDYIRSSLGYSDFIAQGIDRFGVGEAAAHLVFSESTRFPSTFLLNRVDGEEPLVIVTVDFSDVNGENMEFHLDELKRKLLTFGLSEEQLEKIVKKMTEGKKNRIGVLELVQMLDALGYARVVLINFLRDIGVGEHDISKIFMRI